MNCLKYLVFFCLIIPLVKSDNLINSKYWYFSCSSSECTTAINSCLNCLGERMCKACITNTNPNCSTCANDIFNKDDLENIDGIPYFVCESSDPFQSKVCHFYCRGQYSQFGQCNMDQNLPVCKCSTSFSTTPPTTIFNSPKQKIDVPIWSSDIYGSIIVLRNGDIVRGHESEIHIYNSTTGQKYRTLPSSYSNAWAFGQLSNGFLVSAHRGNKFILIWDLNIVNDEPIKKIIPIDQNIFSLTVLKNDDLAIGEARGANKSDIIIRNSQNGSIKHTLVGHKDYVFQIIELDNGNLVSCSRDGTVRIWNLSSNPNLVRTINHPTGVESIAILKNGNLASGLFDGRIEIRNFETGFLIKSLKDHTARICYVNCLHVLHNGDIVSASFEDKTIKVWNPNDGVLKSSNAVHKSALIQLGFLPNKNLISVSYNEIFIW